MRVIADLHLHSRYSRATSKDLTLINLEKYARLKGLNLLGTGDFTHSKWLAELKTSLTEDETGFLKTKSGFNFILQAEVSNIYSQDGKLRKVHNIILAKNFEIVSRINELFSKKGKLESDGRPMFGGYPCYQMVEELKDIDRSIEIIPAHCWTPWFSVFGSSSGFDSVEECFKDTSRFIHALETGLSSDPAMNWRLSRLDKYSLISNSDSHSFWPWRIGRECNIFEMKKPGYDGLIDILKTRKGFVKTIEVDPSYGKYHYDGHRNCNISLRPSESLKKNNICPVCRRTLTIGVLHRVEQLADRPEGFVPKGAVPFQKLIPLHEIIGAVVESGVASQKTWKEYNNLIAHFGSELDIMLKASGEELKKITTERIATAIIRNREEKIEIVPGYDGEYGYPVFGKRDELKQNMKELKKADEIKKKGQLGLDAFC